MYPGLLHELHKRVTLSTGQEAAILAHSLPECLRGAAKPDRKLTGSFCGGGLQPVSGAISFHFLTRAPAPDRVVSGRLVS